MDRYCKKLNISQRHAMLFRYALGERSGLIAKDFGVTNTLVNGWARRYGLATNRTSRRHSINPHAFKHRSPDMEYWVGFLMADGCVSNGYVRLGLSVRDIDQVAAFQKYIGSTHPIRVRRCKGSFGGGLSAETSALCPAMQADLEFFGVTPRKTSVGKACGGIEKSPHFWRGVIDGDGSVGMYLIGKSRNLNAKVTLSGGRALLEQFCCFVEKTTGAKVNIGTDKRSKVLFSVHVNGYAAVKLLRAIYDNPPMALERKLKKVRDIFATYDSRV